ncbi:MULTISPECIES: pesticin C-terminus-like muramidase [Pseudomonas]|uniref:Pesticin C-terminus-like muramidase n=1 Tax=Pseudomonas idahonensis TaxID=2942628 RepID=A0ABT5PXN3_9PSED|nr:MULTISPECIES: pesticin C-terminus-like muramidase [Pseudomonas]MBW8353265.1 peptidase [Pseudomonas sp.]MCO7580085.1 pesticin C-terminus-like muramidase [Pseudomonas protegens]MCO7586192.1 pesticin C-terminus-like muramidase [Pseudomonas chlororaphis]MCO7603298.1 pesticin C-terminus-like muramidase [Pseudomonas chlororaphis]MCY7258540.1 peptidase [Pseudomonas protegens]
MSRYAIDFSFIAALEGGAMTRGYVPDAANSKSGVTVGTGFDLGQRGVKDLQALNLPADLVRRLTPYLGLTGLKAKAFLDGQPLSIGSDEAELIDEAFKAPFVDRLAANYAKASGVDFAQLPAPMQTVIASVAFQYGDLASRTPKFWAQVVARDWSSALANLRNFGDSYGTRRRKEADLLSSQIAS